MKTPEEVKKGIPCDGPCNVCPYKGQIMSDGGCSQAVTDDTLALIQQLERERDEYASELHGICVRCTHVKKCLGPKCYLVEVGMEENTGCDQCCCRNCVNGNKWQWRGGGAGVMSERKTVSQCVSSDYCKGWNDAVDAMQKWIGVDERLPPVVAESNWDKKTENVLAIEENGNFHVGRFFIYKYDGAYEFVSGYECPLVTHWMPLPEPPKEVEG